VLSHHSASRLHGLGELVNDSITITVPRRRTVRDPDVRVKLASLTDADVTLLDGLPVTTVLRTICDLLDQHVDASHIATIIRQGVEAGLVQLDVLAEHLAPYTRRYGARPHDGEGLLDHLLNQIGLSTADLALRPVPAAIAAGFTRAANLAALGSAHRNRRFDPPFTPELSQAIETLAAAESAGRRRLPPAVRTR
jgi:hypothetical protein